MVGRSIPPCLRRSSDLCSRMSSQARWTMRMMPASPTNMWCAAQVPLLLDRRGLRVALGDDEAAEGAAILARHLLPGGLALVIAEVDLATGLRLGQEDPPAVLGHPHIVELRPALGVHAHGRAEVGLLGLEAERSHVLPPLEKLRLPVLEGPLEPPVLVQANVVGTERRIIDAGHQTLLRSNSLRWPVP